MTEQTPHSDDVAILVWDNPAKRLLDLIDKMRSLPFTEPAIPTWHVALESVGDFKKFCRRLSLASGLPDNVLSTMKLLYPDLHPKVNQHWHAQTSNIFRAFDTANTSWQNVVSKVDDHAHSGLIAASALIESKKHPKARDAEHLDEAYALLGDLEKEISDDSSLSPSLKMHLLAVMESLRTSIEERFLTGLKPLEAAVDKAFGGMRMADYNDFASSTKGDKFRTVVQDLANIVTIVGGTAPAAALAYTSLLKFLPA